VVWGFVDGRNCPSNQRGAVVVVCKCPGRSGSRLSWQGLVEDQGRSGTGQLVVRWKSFM